MSTLKEQLYEHCRLYLIQRMKSAQRAIEDLQHDANNETKSTAGDKYETSLEMIQQEINRELARLYELQKQKAVLDQIDPKQQTNYVQPGTLVYTNNGNYFISISAGHVSVDNDQFLAISAASPIALKLSGLKQG